MRTTHPGWPLVTAQKRTNGRPDGAVTRRVPPEEVESTRRELESQGYTIIHTTKGEQ